MFNWTGVITVSLGEGVSTVSLGQMFYLASYIGQHIFSSPKSSDAEHMLTV